MGSKTQIRIYWSSNTYIRQQPAMAPQITTTYIFSYLSTEYRIATNIFWLFQNYDCQLSLTTTTFSYPLRNASLLLWHPRLVPLAENDGGPLLSVNGAKITRIIGISSKDSSYNILWNSFQQKSKIMLFLISLRNGHPHHLFLPLSYFIHSMPSPPEDRLVNLSSTFPICIFIIITTTVEKCNPKLRIGWSIFPPTFPLHEWW